MDDIKDALQNSFIECLPKEEKDSPPTLYHYTDIEGLHGILENMTFWATHYLFLNDSEEVTYFEKLLFEVVSEMIQSNTLPDYMLSIVEMIEYKLTALSERKILHVRDGIFVVSFTSRSDDLNQWRAYAKNGKGYSIGIKKNKLVAQGFNLHKIIYDPKIQKSYIKDTLEIFINYLEKKYNKIVIEKSPQHIASTLDSLYSAISPIFKNPAFKDEEEYRMIFKGNGTYKNQVKLRKSSIYIPYLDCSLETNQEYEKNSYQIDSNSPIKEIILGPALDEYAYFGFYYMNYSGDNISPKEYLKKSNIPYVPQR